MRNDGPNPQWIVGLVNHYKTIEGKGNQIDNGQILRDYGLSQENYDYYVAKTNNSELTDYQASLLKSMDNHRRLAVEMPGYMEAPIPIKKMVLDLAYNTNVKDVVTQTEYPGLHNEMSRHNWIGAIAETLDSANESGFVMPGLMKRRAWAANEALIRVPRQVMGEYLTAREQNKYLELFGGLDVKGINVKIEKGGMRSRPIRSVTATVDGKSTYYDIDGNAIYRYKNKKGLHPQSLGAAGVPDLGLEGVVSQRVVYGH